MNIVLYCTLEMHEEYWIGFWFLLRSNLEAISIALWKHLNENYHRKLEQKNVFSVKLSQRKVWIWREHFWYSSNFDIIFVHTEINLFKSTSDSLSRVKFQRIECFILHRAISKVEHFRCYSIVFCHKNELNTTMIHTIASTIQSKSNPWERTNVTHTDTSIAAAVETVVFNSVPIMHVATRKQ